MAEPATDADTQPPVQAEELLGLSPQLVADVTAALDEERRVDARALVERLDSPVLADLIQLLRAEQRAKLIEYLRPDVDPEILPELEDTVRDEVVDLLGVPTLARAIARLESDDALFLISSLTEEKQRQVLQAIPVALRAMLEEGLAFPEDSAGRLMQRDFVAVPAFWTVGETIDFMRESDSLPSDFYDIFVVDPRHRAVGKVALGRLLRTQRPVRIGDIMETDIVTVPVTMDQEEVAFIFAQKDLISAPVVDDAGRVIGAITVDDVVDVIQEEAHEDIMRLGGVTGDDLYEAVVDTGKARFPWLFVNLITAVVASTVIGLFEGTLQKLVFLAVLMPIVASMGGNAGTQTLTVAVRAIAMKHLTRANAVRVLSKEVLVGIFNGLLFAVVVGAIAWFWSDSIGIGLVMAAAMVINLIVAGLAGIAIPLAVARIGIDPAIASGVFLTTVTDVVGFFAFLGLAAWFLI
jgi:magnesium transporter